MSVRRQLLEEERQGLDRLFRLPCRGRAGLSLVDTLSHLSIETYQSIRVVNIADSSIQRKSGTGWTKGFQCFDPFRDPIRVNW